jgi:LAO/AO transport system kinase
MDSNRLLDDARSGDSRAIARVISEVEDGTTTGAEFFAALFRDGGTAWTTGITGAPGSGKSTLTSQLIPTFLPTDGRLAVVAVDPSSPFSGGAILGDRIRMMEHAGDPRVFIRSLANRGSLGGISESTPAVLAVLDGLGFSEILVETVGVGQSEVEIATSADTTVVVVSPGWGDAIQVSKAGFLEVADILVVNKADRPDVDLAVRDLEAMIEIGPHREWRTPVVRTTATTGDGVGELSDAIAAHRAHLAGTDALERRRRVRAARELAAAVRRRVESAVDVGDDGLIARIAARAIDPWSAADALLTRRG